MKKGMIKPLLLAAALFILALQLSSCKDGDKNKTDNNDTVTTATPVAPTAEPVIVASDEELTKNVEDAVKDYPGVTATVSNGEITITGTTTKERLPDLMSSLNALNPKKVNNNLVIRD